MREVKEILILTALPFRKQGNQSLIRFIRMLINHGYKILLVTSGKDANGENKPESKNVEIIQIPMCLHEKILDLKGKKEQLPEASVIAGYYKNLRSEDVIPPFGKFNYSTLLSKWLLYILYIADNFILLFYLLINKHKLSRRVGLVIGYECGYTLISKYIAKILRVKYINKFQGTVLKATDRNLLTAIKYFPYNYFGINSSDLCIMVNDGTDGKYYAEKRGCKNILLEPHGVAEQDYKDITTSTQFDLTKYREKFIIFNNASGSRWKRVDRIIRSLKYIKNETLEKLIILTTYKADDKLELIRFAQDLVVDQYIEFLTDVDHLVSNYLIQRCNVLVMTNDMSNLGNPVLEAIFYHTPVISINDGILDGYLTNGKDSILIDLDDSFDINLASALTKCVENPDFYQSLRKEIKNNNRVNTLECQQAKELAQIIKVCGI
jgi:hypothetical protein